MERLINYFYCSKTLFGVTLQGKVHYLNPIVTEFANVSRCFMATFHNRSEDLTTAMDISCIRVSNISLFYDLKAELSSGDVTGTIEVKLTPHVDFMFEVSAINLGVKPKTQDKVGY